jgi:leucyl/phenylalanyl-tRNA--protein transferase
MTGAVTPADMLNAYAHGYFPMADSADAPDFYWYDPPLRGQLSIDALHISRRLRRDILKHPFEIRTDTAFSAVIDGCAEATPDRPKTWINRAIRDLFIALHEAGFAHSVECWRDGSLVGGIYGLALNGAFCGESMFSRVPGASKIALVHLCARLWRGGFTLFDTQFVNPHLSQFGVYEIPGAAYRDRLAAALTVPANFAAADAEGPESTVHAYLAHIKAAI